MRRKRSQPDTSAAIVDLLRAERRDTLHSQLVGQTDGRYLELLHDEARSRYSGNEFAVLDGAFHANPAITLPAFAVDSYVCDRIWDRIDERSDKQNFASEMKAVTPFLRANAAWKNRGSAFHGWFERHCRAFQQLSDQAVLELVDDPSGSDLVLAATMLNAIDQIGFPAGRCVRVAVVVGTARAILRAGANGAVPAGFMALQSAFASLLYRGNLTGLGVWKQYEAAENFPCTVEYTAAAVVGAVGVLSVTGDSHLTLRTCQGAVDMLSKFGSMSCTAPGEKKMAAPGVTELGNRPGANGVQGLLTEAGRVGLT